MCDAVRIRRASGRLILRGSEFPHAAKSEIRPASQAWHQMGEIFRCAIDTAYRPLAAMTKKAIILVDDSKE